MRNANCVSLQAFGFFTHKLNRIGIVPNTGKLGNGLYIIMHQDVSKKEKDGATLCGHCCDTYHWTLSLAVYSSNTGTIIAAILENRKTFQQGLPVQQRWVRD